MIAPGRLRLPPGRIGGADPMKLTDQVRQFGGSTLGMLRIQVTEGANGELMINDGVTRATRIHRFAPAGTLVTVEIIDVRPAWDLTRLPTVSERS